VIRVIEYDQFGDAGVLRVAERAVPEPGAGEVRIRVVASGVNPIDCKTRQGLGFVSSRIRDALPWVPGYDLAGLVEAVGEEVDLEPGTPVCGMVNFPLPGGACAEAAVCPADQLVTVSSDADLSALAALPLAGLTAVQALGAFADLSGKRVLVLGGAGGVGHIACQWAVKAGARVSATASSADHQWLGTRGIEALDRRSSQGLPAKAFDRVVDLVGGETGRVALAAVADGGEMVTVPSVTAASVIEAGRERGVSVSGLLVQPDSAVLAALVAAVADGSVQLRVAGRHPATDAAKVHRLLESGGAVGKHVLCW
jgi:NADPH2:quinone reductase